ncbi:SGNH/GDSL hydrolase family protein, partial [Nocardiopsis umidischolae]|nr:SGNH/GDSL hydrolase family protein [Nocardiopsis umidischolae]
LQILEGPERTLYVSRETLEDVDPEQLMSELGGPLDPVRGPEPSGSPANEADAP